MWLPKANGSKKGGNALVAVAIDKDKSSQNALKWALENLLSRGQTVVLIHVLQKAASHGRGFFLFLKFPPKQIPQICYF